ncbi:hypothetical protein, partial [Paraclostridium sp. AKS73]|uniref:hypothetical protein n=1 Tax=Paraclostridium sp. AKS73 TaxID=2876116 RepID=UPI0021E040EE
FSNFSFFLYGIFLFRQDSRNFFAGILLTFGSLGFLFLLVMYLSDRFDTIRLLSILQFMQSYHYL